MEDGCPIPDTHRRLASVHTLWHQTSKLYSNPEGFRTNLNATIQELRNVTFILQKEHRKIPDFDAWYSPHRAQLQANHLMMWLTETRNRVVKQGDLETNSRAIVSLVDGYFDHQSMSFEIPARATSEQIAAFFADGAPPTPWLQDAYLLAERRWEVPELPGRELLEVLAECYGILSLLVADAHKVAGSRYEAPGCGSSNNLAGPKSRPGVPACLTLATELRTARVEIRSKNVLSIRRRKLKPSRRAADLARSRYAQETMEAWVQALKSEDYEVIVRALHANSLEFIKTDLRVTMVLHLFKSGRPVHVMVLAPANKGAKYQLFREVAELAGTKDADAVMVTSEIWVHALESPGTEPGEAVSSVYERADGVGLTLTTPFRRVGGGIILDELIEDRETKSWNTLEPTRVVWRKRGLRP